MKSISCLLYGLGFFLFIATNAYGAPSPYQQPEGTNTSGLNGGEEIFIDASATKSADPVRFQPSTNVVITGESDQTGFAHGGYHNQVLAKKNGKAFAMASDASNVFFLDISADGTAFAAVDLAGVTNADLLMAAGDWTTM